MALTTLGHSGAWRDDRAPLSIAFAVSLGLMAGGASAAVVTYDNHDGTFQWTRTIKLLSGDPQYGTFLDIRKPPTQSGERLPGTLGSWYRLNFTTSSPGEFTIEGVSAAAIAQADVPKLYEWNGEVFSYKAAREYGPKEAVDGDDAWRFTVSHYWSLPFDFGFEGGTPLIAPSSYLGVRIETSANVYNYGWILFENWTDPVAWAYETVPNTPIAIPVPGPGSAVTLLSTITIVGSRRRRGWNVTYE